MATERELREYVRKATGLLQEARRELQEAREARRQPIAIVGMGCRLPSQIATPEELWRLLCAGGEAVSLPPAHRGWDLPALLDPDPDRPGTAYCLAGGFLHDADAFDAGFFELSAAEATAMDPQQRLLLEVSWEAVERAGIAPPSLQGTRTGVYVGLMPSGYGASWQASPEAADRLLSLGRSVAAASSRIAYALGLRGPAVSTDAACASSLVSLHLACQALRAGECDLALAGGATVMAAPTIFLEQSRQRALAPDGRCKPFSAAADGTGWAEGVTILALERLADARRTGHPVHALIRGSAVNHDGKSQGFTAPNGTAEEALIREALDAAGLDASDVDVVEAHATGTPLGDAIEAGALLATYGRAHTAEQPVWLGSLKPNIGHTQAAAGITGVMKLALAFAHDRLPAAPHAGSPSTRVDWSQGGMRLLAEAAAWPRANRPRRAAVSAFGVGTNAHVIVEEAPASSGAPAAIATERAAAAPGTMPLLLSAASAAALRAHAGRLADHLERHAPPLADVAWTLAVHRAHLRVRAAVPAPDHATAVALLRRLAAGDRAAEIAADVDRGQRRPVFVFSGAGEPWPGMGRDLLHAELPAFARAVDACDAAVAGAFGWSVRDLLLASDEAQARALTQPELAGPASFTIAYALAATWEAWGVRPAAVLGLGAGQSLAACIEGRIDLAAAVATAARAAWQAPPARPGDRLAALRSAGHAVFLEVSSHPGLADDLAAAGVAAGSLRRGTPGRAALTASAAALHVAGVALDWSAVPGARGRLCMLPTYPFQHARYWLADARPAIGATASSRSILGDRVSHPSPADLRAMTEADRERFLIDLVCTEAAAVLGLGDGESVDAERSLFQLGCDSLRAVQLRNRLRALTNRALSATLVFDNPTARAIGALLARELAAAEPARGTTYEEVRI